MSQPLQVISRLAKASLINMLFGVPPLLAILQEIYLSGQTGTLLHPVNSDQSLYEVDQIILRTSIINPSFNGIPFTFLVTNSFNGTTFDPTGYNMSNAVCCHQCAPMAPGGIIIPQQTVSILKFEPRQFIQTGNQPFTIYGGGDVVNTVDFYVTYCLSIYYRRFN
jgi:hypothetical protein